MNQFTVSTALSSIPECLRPAYVVSYFNLWAVDIYMELAALAARLKADGVEMVPDTWDERYKRSIPAGVPHYNILDINLAIRQSGFHDDPEIYIGLEKDNDPDCGLPEENTIGSWRIDFSQVRSNGIMKGAGAGVLHGLNLWSDVADFIQRVVVSRANLTGDNPFVALLAGGASDTANTDSENASILG